MIKKDQIKTKKPKDYWNKRAAIFAIVSIIITWIIGYAINNEAPPDCKMVLPSADFCKPLDNDSFEGVIQNEDRTETIVGWASLNEAPGYAGPVKVMVGIDPAGTVLGTYVTSNSETPNYYERIENEKFLEEFIGLPVISPFKIGEEIEAVTRATVTSNAIAEAVRTASYTIAETQLGLEVETIIEPIKFGAPEIAILGLYLVGYIGHRGNFKYKKQVRWLSLIIGMVYLGFIFNIPVTVANFTSLLLGYFPNWRTNLYWFFLMGGILFVSTVDNKNPYCQWFCPFGAAQECLGAIGGARLWSPGKSIRRNLEWIQRGLAFGAIILGLLMRNPGFSSFEIFGNLFSFTGSWPQWVILVIVLLLSLFIKRPWCNYLCPIDPIMDLVLASHRWIKQEFRKIWQLKNLKKNCQSEHCHA